MKNQSERQLGAFVFSYLLHAKVAPELLNSKQTEFRNAVIHKGRIPSRTEAVTYAESVLQLMVTTLAHMKLTLSAELTTVSQEKYLTPVNSVDGAEFQNHFGFNSMVAAYNFAPPPYPMTVAGRLQALAARKAILKTAVEMKLAKEQARDAIA